MCTGNFSLFFRVDDNSAHSGLRTQRAVAKPKIYPLSHKGILSDGAQEWIPNLSKAGSLYYQNYSGES